MNPSQANKNSCLTSQNLDFLIKYLVDGYISEVRELLAAKDPGISWEKVLRYREVKVTSAGKSARASRWRIRY